MTDWPTLFAVCAFWVSLIALISAGSHLPAPLQVAVLGLLGGFYMSLQHEVIHGHPTRSHRFNWLLVGIPLGLVLPFSRYRVAHLAHHNSDLTNPVDDPESFYVLAAEWDNAGPVKRALLSANRTLAGRLVMGPVIMSWRSLTADRFLLARSADVRFAWLTHVVGASVVLTVLHESSLPIWVYLLGFVYVGSALTSLRSFAEHKALDGGFASGTSRSAIVTSGWFFSLLFLNNNLHHTHHQLPGAAWFRLPELTEALDSVAVVADGAGAYTGYTAIARRFMFRPFEQPVHPMSDSISA